MKKILILSFAILSMFSRGYAQRPPLTPSPVLTYLDGYKAGVEYSSILKKQILSGYIQIEMVEEERNIDPTVPGNIGGIHTPGDPTPHVLIIKYTTIPDGLDLRAWGDIAPIYQIIFDNRLIDDFHSGYHDGFYYYWWLDLTSF